MPEKMLHTFLLYIDILGFGDMCCELDERVDIIYEIIFDMRRHGNQVYEITIFSDTVLVRNKGSLDYRSNVQFLVEFFQILEQRLSDIGVYTRAVMSFDRFHCHLKDDVYLAYGPAVVAANRAEKCLKGVGLYLFDSCAEHNVFYDSLQLDKEKLFYVFTLNAFKKVTDVSFNDLHIITERLAETDDFHLLPQQSRFLRKIHANSQDASMDDRFRSKYRNVMDMYFEKYPKLVSAFVANDFSPNCVNSEFDWSIYDKDT